MQGLVLPQIQDMDQDWFPQYFEESCQELEYNWIVIGAYFDCKPEEAKDLYFYYTKKEDENLIQMLQRKIEDLQKIIDNNFLV